MKNLSKLRSLSQTRRAVFFAPALLVALLLAGCGQGVEVGAAVYAERCLSCHGTVGAGDGGRAAYLPNGVADLQRSRLTAFEQRDIVIKGRKLMPAFGPALEKEELEAVVEFIQGFKKEWKVSQKN